MWSLLSGTPSEIIFNAAIPIGKSVYVSYLSSSISGMAGITGVSNIGGGVGVFAQIAGTIAQLKTLVGLGDTTVTEDASHVYISSTGGGGGGGPVAVGSFGAPQVITPSGGITPTSALDQVWWITSSVLSAGAQPTTATPQIAAGTSIGQRLTLFGVTNGSGGYVKLSNGNGILSNGDFGFLTGQCVVYCWDGTQWSFVSNAI